MFQWRIEDFGGMSDLSVYELEDNVWDEFSESDDHIVPHPGHEYGDQFGVQGDGCKKSRHELINVAVISDDISKYNTPRKEETSLPTSGKKEKMLEKGSWSHTPDDVFPASCNSSSVKEATNIASGEVRSLNPCLKSGDIDSVASDFFADDLLMGEKCVVADNNEYHYPLGNISQTSNDLSFFDDDHVDKERSDFLYYGWPDDIGNFEDVDRMFRSCDSTFGLGSLSDEDNMCWFSSSHSPEGSNDALKLASKFSSSEASALNGVSHNHETSELNSVGPSINDSNEKICMGDTTRSWSTGSVDHHVLEHLTFPNGSDTKSINWNKKQARHKSQSEGKRKDRNVVSSHPNGNLKQFSERKHPLRDSPCQNFPPAGIQRHKQKIRSDTLDYMPTHIPYMHIDYSCSPDQSSLSQKQSAVKSERKDHLSTSPKDSSYASNQLQSVESSHGPPFKASAMTNSAKREALNQCQDLQPSFKPANLASPTASYSTVSVPKRTSQHEYEIESPSNIEGVSVGIPGELDYSNAQESSCMSSVLDDISVEATSFHQLQQVMEKLDVRTKLCIRDSLYRLARSAEQRHKFGNSGGSNRDDRDTMAALANEETNKSTGFMDMETGTNPIDRSIAHLLFHRPTGVSGMHINDALSMKSSAMDHASITSPPVLTKEQVCQEGIAMGADKNLSMSDKKQ